MSNSRKRRAAFAAPISALETRCLLSGVTGTWIGQDGHDLVGPGSIPGGDDVQDIRIALSGLPADNAVTSVNVRGLGGGEWTMNPPPGPAPWAAALTRAPKSTSADLFIEPYQVENHRTFSVELDYADGTKDYLWVKGGTADPNLRMPHAALTAGWIGQTNVDLTGLGPNVGPDGKVDTQIRLGNLSITSEITSAVLTSQNGSTWTFGTNPQAGNSAELIRRSADPTTADFSFQADHNLVGQSLTLVLNYGNGKTDSQSLVAGVTSPTLSMPTPPPLAISSNVLTGQWIGQVDDPAAGRGAVKATIGGIPTSRTIAAATLSDPVGGSWTWVAQPDGPIFVDPAAGTLILRRSTSDLSKADLLFPPSRNELGSDLTVRLVLDDGTTIVNKFIGGLSDVSKRAPLPASSSVVAKPGDDLNLLATKFGAIRLSAGIYNLTEPLVLNSPVTITADPGATLLFSQPANSAEWSAAIKIKAGNTTLDNFAVRFSGPIRWRSDISYGPAVIGTSDNTDPPNGNILVGINLTRLDLQGPQANSSWDEAIRLMRLVWARSGRVVGNTLKGGPVEFFGGPWTVTDNTFLGTMPNTYSYNIFSVHATHDLDLSRNVVSQAFDAGKTWRFLVMTYGGSNDVIQNNMISGIGPIDGDGVPDVNANEIILTEAYSLKFEGVPSSVSADGRIVQISTVQGDAPQAGDVVAILSGTGAGQYRRIAQVLSPTAYLLDSGLPAGSGAISIAMGFVGETFQNNTVDARSSIVASDLVLAGNHYGTKVIGNHFMGGAYPLRLEASPSEHPNNWGWSHVSFLGATISGNTLEDGWIGSSLSVSQGTPVKTSRGRTYFSGEVSDNTFGWSQAFLTKRLKAGFSTDPLNLILDGGDSAGLSLTVRGNRVLEPAGMVPGGSLQITSAMINGVFQARQTITLPTAPPLPPSGLSLVNDTGISATDGITNDSRMQIDALRGSATGAEYRLAGSTTYSPIPATGLFTPAGLVQGVNIVSVRLYDVTGNRGPETSLRLTYDTVAPSPSAPILLPESDSGRSQSDGITNVTAPGFVVQGSDFTTAVLLRDGVAVAQRTDAGVLRDPGSATDGLHSYTVKATDLAGNTATSPSTTITIDTVPPSPPSSLSSSNDGKVSFASGGGELVYEYRLNNATNYTPIGSATNLTLTGMIIGANQVKVRSVDVAGNASADASVTFIYNPVAIPKVLYLGQDGHDYTGSRPSLGGDGYQDMNFSLQNLPPGRWIRGLQVRGVGGGFWSLRSTSGAWAAAVLQVPGATSADVFIQPTQLSTNRTYNITITFDNGQTLNLSISGVTSRSRLPVGTSLAGQPRPTGDLPPLNFSPSVLGSQSVTTTTTQVVGHTWQRPSFIIGRPANATASKTITVKHHSIRRHGV